MQVLLWGESHKLVGMKGATRRQRHLPTCVLATGMPLPAAALKDEKNHRSGWFDAVANAVGR